MNRIILVFTLFLTISVFADNHPFYTKESLDDVQFAVQDIAHQVKSYCNITIMEQKIMNGIVSQAHFNCDSSDVKIDKKISWEGVKAQEFNQLIKNRFENLLIKISTTLEDKLI